MHSTTDAPMHTNNNQSSRWRAPKPGFLAQYRMLREIACHFSHHREAAWYGLYNLVLSSLIERSQGPDEHLMAIMPQIPITVIPFSERPIEADGNIPTSRKLRSELQNPEELQSLSTTITDFDSISAQFTSMSISATTTSSSAGASSSASGEPAPKEVHKYPDTAVLYGRALEALPQDSVMTEDSLDFLHSPCLRILLLIEIKRLPENEFGVVDKRGIERILDCDMKQQVFYQVRAAFLRYPNQERIVHLSCVGDYFKIRIFHRKVFEDKGFLSPEDATKDPNPTWGQITNSSKVPMSQIIAAGDKDIHGTIKKNWTESRRNLTDAMEAELKKAKDERQARDVVAVARTAAR
ncbi:hypothetical protein BDY19DRAFT_995221 [Irpex rosettiformis]|uniref:Uncharacterized protein n=1 Tax=Irpex rosettiformis TaxID=378272 RepID=A0ACB8TYV3_9APHY|nr:hypothetical protein BDY19DRAFT_995221 [Irpex rosettiformis]